MKEALSEYDSPNKGADQKQMRKMLENLKLDSSSSDDSSSDNSSDGSDSEEEAKRSKRSAVKKGKKVYL